MRQAEKPLRPSVVFGPENRRPLRLPLGSGPAHSELAAAIADSIRNEAKKLAAELKSGATVSDDVAGRYLRENSLSKLDGDLPETTKQRLRDAMADAWAAGGSFNQIVKAIQDTVGEISDVRAGIIAQTEVNSASNQGRIASATEAGFEEKSWDPDGECCEECEKQIAAGWIRIDEPFPGGVMVPCLHDGCDCGINFRKGAVESVVNIDEVKISEVKSMIRDGREEEAESVLLGLVAVIEEEAQIRGRRVGTWCYERLAIIYRRRRDYASEIAILTRYFQRGGNSYGSWDARRAAESIQKRSDRARGLLTKASGPPATLPRKA
jgi:hypothetical protein